MNVLSLLQELLMKIDTVIRLTQDCPLTKTDDVGWLRAVNRKRRILKWRSLIEVLEV